MRIILQVVFSLLLAFSASHVCAQEMKMNDSSKNAGKVEWGARQVKLGEIPYGIPVTRTVTVKNIHNENLVVTNVRSGCHCTSVEWPQEPIEPGQSGEIKLTFDAGREGDFYKIVSVFTNFDPDESVVLVLVGKVAPKVPVASHK